MPSKSPVQARLMAAAAHTPGGYGGVPQSVGKEFNTADRGTGILSSHKPHPAYRHGGTIRNDAAGRFKSGIPDHLK